MSTSVSPFSWGKDINRYSMVNSLVNFVPELPHNKVIPADAFKSIITGDPVTVRPLYRNPVTARLFASHIFSGNYLIKSDDTSSGFLRRWLYIRWDKPIKNRKVNYSAYLIQREAEEIFSWCIDGYVNLMQKSTQDFSVTPQQKKVEYNTIMKINSVVSFLMDEDYVIQKEKSNVTRLGLYSSYRTYCKDNSIKPLNKVAFTNHAEKMFEMAKDKDGIVIFRGLELKLI